MSSNDFNGPYRPAGGRGADGGAGKYPDPEGWGDDGFWRDSSMDSEYETGLNKAVRTSANGPGGNGGYSYWADGRGWENSPGSSAAGNTAAGNGARGSGQHRRHGAGGNGHRNNGARNNGAGSATRMDSYATRADQGATAFHGGQEAVNGNGPTGWREGWRNPITGPWRTGRGTRGGGPSGPVGPGGPIGPGGPGRGKIKGSWWRHWTWKKALAIAGSAFVLFILLLVGTYYYLYNSTQIPTDPVRDISFQNSTVFYGDGKTAIGSFGTIHRQILTYNQIPKKLQDAVMAAEDRSFMTEGGISPTGIMRAAWEDVFGGGGSLQGGSTITQEFVRGYYQDIGTEQTTSRKIKEIFVAMKLSKEKSKQWILTNYLNMIYLGTGAYGVGAAAQTYFHEPVGKLTVAQAAVIAAIIQQPTNYPQPRFRSNLISRWHYVLNGMVSMGDLTQQQAAAMKFPKMYDKPEQSYGSDPWDPYVMDVVQNELEGVEHITQQQLDTGGYKIVTTISRSKELALYKSVNENVHLIYKEGFTLPSYAMIGAELQDPASGAIIAMYPGRGQNMSAKKCKIYKCQLNTAVYTREQVGSSFKPYVLAAAVSDGMNVQTSVLNASPRLWVPLDTPPDNMMLSATSAAGALPGSFEVENDGGEVIAGAKANGAVTVQNALAQSSNTAYSDLAHRVGTGNIIQMAADMGVNIAPFPSGSGLTDLLHQVNLALGTASLTVNEQTTMLSTIDDNGLYHSAHIIKTYQASGGPVKPGVVTQRQVLTPELDSQVQYAMEMTTVDGTGTAAAMTDGRPIIGKTGTTTNSHSAFFIGGIPQWTLAVGIFTQSQNANDTSQSLNLLGGGGFGGTWPAAIWHTFAEMEFAGLPVMQFQAPDFTGAKWVQVHPLPKKKKHHKGNVCKFRFGCPTQPPGKGHHHHPFPTPTVTTPTPTSTLPSGQPSPSGTTTGSPSPSTSQSGSSSPSGQPTSPPPGGGQVAGLALGGVLSVLPGSLLWTRAMSRRRRKRRPGGIR